MDSDVVDLRIERLLPGGIGLARLPDGLALVRGVVPGDRVRVRLRRRKNHWDGDLLEVLEPSPDRVDTSLPPHADLPLRYPVQLQIKQEFVIDSLRRLGGRPGGPGRTPAAGAGSVADSAAEPQAGPSGGPRPRAPGPVAVAPICPSPCELGYRTAVQWAVGPAGGLAYRSPGTHDLLPLAGTDTLACPAIQALIPELAGVCPAGVTELVVRASLSAGRILLGIVGPAPEPAMAAARHWRGLSGVAGVTWAQEDTRGRFRGRVRHLGGEAALLEDFGGLLCSVSVTSFSQVNPAAAGQLYHEAAGLAGTGTHAVDLFGGSGVLGLHLASQFEAVTVLEISAAAVTQGEADRERLGLANVRFWRGDARRLSELDAADLVAVDPPRAGLPTEVVTALLERRPDRILYVSCDPATWARDVARLEAGGYALQFVRPYDFYPYTHHVEVLSLLRLGQ